MGASYFDRDTYKCEVLPYLIPETSARKKLVLPGSSLVPGSQELHPLLEMHPNQVSEVSWYSSDFILAFACLTSISWGLSELSRHRTGREKKNIVFCLEKPLCMKNEKDCVSDGEMDTVGCTCLTWGKEGLTLYITDQESGGLSLLNWRPQYMSGL